MSGGEGGRMAQALDQHVLQEALLQTLRQIGDSLKVISADQREMRAEFRDLDKRLMGLEAQKIEEFDKRIEHLELEHAQRLGAWAPFKIIGAAVLSAVGAFIAAHFINK